MKSKKTIAMFLVVAFLAISMSLVSVFAATWTTTTVGASQAYTESVALAIDNNGNPHVAYVDSNNNLDYASWTGTSWNIQTVATDAQYSGTSGSWVSLALDSNGNPYISYYALITSTYSYELKYAYLSGGSWATQVVDSNMAGLCNSIALDANGNPHIAYYSMANYGLMYASLAGGQWTTTQVDSGDAKCISLAFDSSGNPHIAYQISGNLKYASLSGSTWTTTTVASVYSYGVAEASLAFSPTTHNPSISYSDESSSASNLMYVAFSGSSWGTPVEVDPTSGIQFTSLAFSTQGNPAIAYYSTSGNLKFATYQSGWSPQTVDSNDAAASLNPVSLAFTANGTPTIAYASAQGGTCNIKVTTEAGNFFVMPEYAYGALAALTAAFVAVAAFAVIKKRGSN